ncbi:YlzJ-like family protein [Salimicrobium halophilum]|uniref:YlzJ-like protein n=1 Tax=Salimicrobium halophilum TaxID=86666 RepID=A0A1G8Q8B9_9BACI|nr:YlzJ-like family protein [Salimicrobium halophilum]SDJ00838.1 YlzJ-like protein [Salimicrobium halophilum]
MMHYTPLDPEDILEEEEIHEKEKAFGEKFLIFRGNRMERLISTDPNDFMNPELQPGLWLKSTDV